MLEVRERGGAGWPDQERSYLVGVPAAAPWARKYRDKCLPVAVRWLDGSDGRWGSCQLESSHGGARFPRAWFLSSVQGSRSAAQGAKLAF